jgi:hypothetical protein
MTTHTADLVSLTAMSTIFNLLKCVQYAICVVGNPEIVQSRVDMFPGWLPSWIEIVDPKVTPPTRRLGTWL